MRVGAKYTSLDGVHFDEVGSNKTVTYYPYFQFQSVRQPSNYTGAELDAYVSEILIDRQQTGIARYQDAPYPIEVNRSGELFKSS